MRPWAGRGGAGRGGAWSMAAMLSAKPTEAVAKLKAQKRGLRSAGAASMLPACAS